MCWLAVCHASVLSALWHSPPAHLLSQPTPALQVEELPEGSLEAAGRHLDPNAYRIRCAPQQAGAS